MIRNRPNPIAQFRKRQASWDDPAIALYRREKEAYLARHAGEKDALLESVRRQLASGTDEYCGNPVVGVNATPAKDSVDRWKKSRANGQAKVAKATAARKRTAA